MSPGSSSSKTAHLFIYYYRKIIVVEAGTYWTLLSYFTLLAILAQVCSVSFQINSAFAVSCPKLVPCRSHEALLDHDKQKTTWQHKFT